MDNNVNVYIGVAAAINIFILSIVFLYFNPYSNQMLDKEVYITVFFMFLLPSFLAVIAVLVRKKILMILCGGWLLPGTLYFSVVAMPTLWNLYIIFLMIYFISIVWMKKRNA
ncbi:MULTISPECIES: hypothetical protein [Bacillus]|uniref:Uncharacterized protein n=2 Tax=Bacillus cereus group TaxID=86661 RepID=A0A2C1DNK3_BACCE|nr:MULTISPECIES: hypothetical protein [Bacillus cereus group]OFD77330.1 hypothetical protein BWGOE8_31980 [Bacillus mycoides]OFD77616.1 hypothetical protein BWGOE9_32040 [Bacillus mycoides]OFD79016.1 hypothetical protein BWGOE10_32460 [Bacillus mycoides]PGT02007.1 hypothetical protein COD09_13555 [Bacillus cereus]